ncbi:MAG: UDP-N-acetylmuramyl-tripeptide synthetase, partial [Gemmatimonadota bacterium]
MSSPALQLDAVVEILRKAGLVTEVHGTGDVSLLGASQDSRTVRAGDLFLAWRGVDADAHDFVAAAAEAGAVAAVVERFVPEAAVPQVRVTDGRLAAALAADALHGSPWRQLFTCGITGTNGKTTTALLTRHLLGMRGSAAAIGTLGVVGADGQVLPETEGLTTPGPVALSGWLRKLVDDDFRSVTLEASSHALDQRRLDGMRFDVAVFTNFGGDHLDYHGDADAYLTSKARLVELLAPSGAAVVNADDAAWAALADAARGGVGPGRRRFVTFAIDVAADVRASGVVLLPSGARFTLHHEGGSVDVLLPLPGRFNVENALAAAAVGLVSGLSLQEVAAGLERAPQVPGRLEVLCREPFTVAVDFAHTADALARVLTAVRPLVRGRLIVLFGAGGDR